MKILSFKHFPPNPFAATMLCGMLIHRADVRLSQRTIRHETIHHHQQREMLWLPFFAWYIAEWAVRLVLCGFKPLEAYRNLSMEREAYRNDHDPSYLARRRPWAWLRHLRK